ELLRAIIETAEEKKSPAIIQIHPNELNLVGDEFIAYVREAANKASVPIVIHQDHCDSIEGTIRAIRNGYTSVMIDGSHLSFEDNIALTQEAVRVAHSVGVSVEAELGTIGENEGSSEGGADEILYTEHLPPKIQSDRLEKINNLVDIPLVLHGGSSNPDEDIRSSVQHGVSKINLSSDMKGAFFKQLRKTLKEKPNDFEPDVLFPEANEAAKYVLREKMDLFGSSNKASLYKLGDISSNTIPVTI